MESLDASTASAYRVTTKSATYLIDLERMVIHRSPHPDGAVERSLRHDNDPIALLGIHCCTVGHPMTLYLDLGLEHVGFTVRRTTTVVSIEPLMTRVPLE